MESLTSVKDFEVVASRNLPKAAYDYYRSGANASVSLHDNEYAFRKMHLKTRVFS
jgi:isopentenyl diphosphate isomerase/L-lactate dehydrogenase-like FMN-dependent dehydrogenase